MLRGWALQGYSAVGQGLDTLWLGTPRFSTAEIFCTDSEENIDFVKSNNPLVKVVKAQVR